MLFTHSAVELAAVAPIARLDRQDARGRRGDLDAIDGFRSDRFDADHLAIVPVAVM